MSHERGVLELDDGSRLAYRDVRRFGTWLVLEPGELEPYLAAKNGRSRSAHGSPQAGSPSGLPARRAPLKAAPSISARRRTREHLRRRGALVRAIASAPTCGNDRGRACAGCTVDPSALRARHRPPGLDAFRLPAPGGARGSMQDEFGSTAARRALLALGHAISKARVGGRGTWFCPAASQLLTALRRRRGARRARSSDRVARLRVAADPDAPSIRIWGTVQPPSEIEEPLAEGEDRRRAMIDLLVRDALASSSAFARTQ